MSPIDLITLLMNFKRFEQNNCAFQIFALRLRTRLALILGLLSVLFTTMTYYSALKLFSGKEQLGWIYRCSLGRVKVLTLWEPKNVATTLL